MTDLEALEVILNQAGLKPHFLLCNARREPVQKSWKNYPATAPTCRHRVESKELIGIVPGSLGYVVVDIDGGDPREIIEALGQPHFITPSSTEGHYHMWYRHDYDKEPEVSNVKWPSAICKSDTRGSNGYVVCWDLPGIAEGITSGEPEMINYVKARNEAGWVSKAKDTPMTRIAPSKRRAEIIYERIRRIKRTPKGKRNNELYVNAVYLYEGFDLANNTDAEKAMYDAAIDAGLAPSEVELTMESAKKKGLASPKHVSPSKPGKTETPVDQLNDENLKEIKERRKQRKEELEAPGVFRSRSYRVILEAAAYCGWDVKFDILALRPVARHATTTEGKWAKIDRDLTATIVGDLQDKCKFEDAQGNIRYYSVSLDVFTEAARGLRHRQTMQINPFREWLLSLGKWDGQNRLNNLLAHVVGANNQTIASWAGNYIFVSAILRNQDVPYPGMHEMPVLIGRPGIGKSTVINAAFPDLESQQWFSDELRIEMQGKSLVETVSGKVLVEAAEIKASGKELNLDAWKAFLSRNQDECRPAFGRDVMSYRRTCTVIGTSNRPRAVPFDPHGNRRVIPVICTGTDPKMKDQETGGLTDEGYFVRDYMNQHREQLWAEALVLAGKVIAGNYTIALSKWVSPEKMEEEHKKTRAVDEITQQVYETVMSDMDIEEGVHIETLLKSIDQLGITDAKRRTVQREIIELLRADGFQNKIRKNEDGRRVRLWLKVRRSL